MTKKLLELLTVERLRESKILLENGCFSGAYYLAGYSIECGLKACIANQVNANEIPSKSFILDFYVHDLNKLVKLAGLEKELDEKTDINLDFKINWGIVKLWNEGARYKEWTQGQAVDLYNAIENLKGGLLPWIQQYW